MKTETLEQPELYNPPLFSGARLLIAEAANPNDSPEGVVRSVAEGPGIYLPSNYLGAHDQVVPSLDVITYRGNEAALVPLFPTNARLNSMYERVSKNHEERLERMKYEMLVRILDTSGADGLHHMHSANTKFPRTIFYNVRHGGLQLYMTSLGEVDNGLPVLGVLGATGSLKDESEFLKLVSNRKDARKVRK